MTLLRGVKLGFLQTAQMAGAFPLVQKSGWRKRRLLILCYHGIAVDREHEWQPAFFIAPNVFERRMATFKRLGIRVLPLGEGLRALYDGTLDEPSAAITFDDGFQDYFRLAAPILAQYSIPATVYLTTWYVDRPTPVFEVFSSYVLWLSVGSKAQLGSEFGFKEPPPLNTAEQAEMAARAIRNFVYREKLSGEAKDELAVRLCCKLGIDYAEMQRKRVLGLLNTAEVRKLAGAGTDFELHTHRHRTPAVQELFQKEIADNRAYFRRVFNRAPEHFCYPGGACEPNFTAWLKAEGIRSATTCEPGIASESSDPLRLPRMLDAANVEQVEFEAWLSGLEPRLRRLG